MTNQLRVVASGVDSLYLSAQGKLRANLIENLDELRTAAQGDDTAVELTGGGQAYVLHPYGGRGYRHALSTAGVNMMVGASAHFPPVYAQLRSAFVHRVGAQAALETVHNLLTADLFAGEFRLNASRVDVYADFQGWVPRAADFDHFVCRARRRARYDQGEDAQLFMHGRQLSGFMFGKGDVVARIYNKTLEMLATGEDWPAASWRGADPNVAVWRTEFQLRRGALKSPRMRSADQVLSHRQGLWDYGTKWLSLRVPAGHSRQSRWPEAEEWRALRRVAVGMPSSPLVRERLRGSDERRLLAGWAGYTTSLAALHNRESTASALADLEPAMKGYLAAHGREFGDVVRTKRSRRLDASGCDSQRASGNP
jgi:hypothetical protein